MMLVSILPALQLIYDTAPNRARLSVTGLSVLARDPRLPDRGRKARRARTNGLVAHEINTPLGSSLTVASTLQRKAERFAAEVARGNLRRSTLIGFLELVNDASAQLVTNLGRAAERVQSFKQVAADQTESHRRSLDAGELTGQVLSHFERQLRQRGIALGVD